MAKFRFSNIAVNDLTQIWNYTVDKWYENQAEKYYHMLIGNCNEVACNPEFGKIIQGLQKTYLDLKQVGIYNFMGLLKWMKLK